MNGTEATMTFKWKVINSGAKDWPKSLELVPVMALPKMRMLHSSAIPKLEPEGEADLSIKIDVPGNPALGGYFTMVFKVK